MAVDQESINAEEGGGMPVDWKLVIAIGAVALLCYISFTNDRMCSETRGFCYYTWIIYTIIISGFIVLASLSMIWLKYKSPQFIGNNIHGSITARKPISAGNFYILRLGGIEQFNVEGREATVIFPKEAYNPVGSQTGAPCKFERRSINQLDPVVQDMIIQAGLPKPYWYGDIDESHYGIPAEELDSKLKEDEKKILEKLTEDVGGFMKLNPAQLHVYLKSALEMVSKYRKERVLLMKDAEGVVSFGVRISDKAKSVGGVRDRLRGRDRDEDRR